MTGEARWAATAVTSVVLWFPAMTATMSGELEMADGALRYVVAFAVAWVAVAFVDRLLNGYASASAIPVGPDGVPRRRKDDVVEPPAALDLAEQAPDVALDLDAGSDTLSAA